MNINGGAVGVGFTKPKAHFESRKTDKREEMNHSHLDSQVLNNFVPELPAGLAPLAPTCPAAEGCWSCRVRQFIARKAPDGCLIA